MVAVLLKLFEPALVRLADLEFLYAAVAVCVQYLERGLRRAQFLLRQVRHQLVLGTMVPILPYVYGHLQEREQISDGSQQNLIINTILHK